MRYTHANIPYQTDLTTARVLKLIPMRYTHANTPYHTTSNRSHHNTGIKNNTRAALAPRSEFVFQVMWVLKIIPVLSRGFVIYICFLPGDVGIKKDTRIAQKLYSLVTQDRPKFWSVLTFNLTSS